MLEELKWLYMELYDDKEAFAYFEEMLRKNADERKASLRALDESRREGQDWYQSHKLLGMMLYVQNFGGTLKEVKKHLPY